MSQSLKNGDALIFIMGRGFTAHGGYGDLPLKQLDCWLLERGIFANLMGEKRQVFGPAFDQGFNVFSINYRLSPRNSWRNQLRDVQRAVQFVRADASEYGLKSEWIAGIKYSDREVHHGWVMTDFSGL